MSDIILSRSEVAVEYTWDAESIFATEQAWEDEFRVIDGSLESLKRFEGQLGSSPEMLLDWLETYCDLIRRVQDIFQYSMMFSVVDTSDQKAAGRNSRAGGLYARVSAATAFAVPELLQIGMDTL